MSYLIDIEKFTKQYRIKDPDKKPTHVTDEKLIVPYNVRPLKEHKDIIRRFEECIGSFCCNLLHCTAPKFSEDEFFENIINSVEFEDDSEQQKFRDVIYTIFFDDERGMAKFHPKVLIHSPADEENVEMGKFLYDVLFNEDEEYDNYIVEIFKNKTGNVLSDLILDKLPDIQIGKVHTKKQYKNFARDIAVIFNEDLRYLLKSNREFCTQIVIVLKFYYLVYILRAIGNLNKMFDTSEINPIYFTFDWEKVSRGRVGYENGWCLVENAITTLRSHELCLNILNCTKYEKKYTYIEFKELVSAMNESERSDTLSSIRQAVDIYEKAVVDNEAYWKAYQCKSVNEDEILYQVERLFGLIHNHHSKVKNAIELSRRYYDWFFEFCRNNFLRNRGRNGMTLNLTEEYVILLTKLCIKDNEKVRFQYLIKELERRGVYLDKDSRNRLIDFYQRLNVLEKKSDSGDALYVRSIL